MVFSHIAAPAPEFHKHFLVIFHVDNGWVEWYYSALLPYVHYVPVADDLSDLCAKVEMMRAAPEAAVQMSENAMAFFRHQLHPDVRDMYVGEILLQWGELWHKHVTSQSVTCRTSDLVPLPEDCRCDAASWDDCRAGQYCWGGTEGSRCKREPKGAR